jgi:hypothetical protein
VLAVWEALVAHGATFQAADFMTAAQKRECDMGELFASRAKSCYHSSFPLAFLLDPAFMEQSGSSWHAPFDKVGSRCRMLPCLC